jgi:hypothetical protein
MSYPASLDSFSARTDNSDTVMAADVNGLQVAVVALETHIGTTTAPKIMAGWFYMMSGGNPAVTNGCTSPANLELPTYKATLKPPAFDKDTEQYMDFIHPLPDDYNAGTVTAIVYWTHPATTTNFKVAWAVKMVAIADSATLDAAFGIAQQTNDTGGNTNYLYISPATAAITIGGAPVAGNMLIARVYRVAADGTNDTLAVNAYPLNVKVTYVRTA